MAPTIQNGTNNQDKRAQRPQDKKSELINRVKYSNTLPDIPFDLKFITYPFDNTRFIQYNPTSLERNYRYEVLTEHDLGVTIDLINRELYQANPYAQLEPADEKLLEEDIHTPQDSLRSKHHAKSVSWLRKSEYISTEQTRFQPTGVMEKVEAKVGYNVKKSFVEETLYMDRDAQIKAIQKTFEESKSDIKNHYSKPNVTAMEVFQIFPDFTNWKYPCAQVIFDSDPAEAGKNVPAQIEEMSQAMIRGVMDESGEQFVAYFLPTEETLQKRRRDFQSQILYEDDDEYEYKMAREYNWNVKSKASKGYEENYFLVVRPDGIYYNELETRVRLNKRRQKIGQQQTSTKLVVKHLPLNAVEHRMQRYRERQLEPPGEDDEEELEEEPEEDEEDVNEHETQNDKDADAKKNDDNDYDDKRSDKSRSRSPSKSGSRSRSRSQSKSDESRSGSQSPPDRDQISPSGSKVRSRSESSDGSQRSRRSKSRSIADRSVRSMSRGTNKSRHTSKSGSRSRSISASGGGSPNSKGSRSRSRSPTPQSQSPFRSRLSRSMSRATKGSSRHSRSKSRSQSATGSHSPSRSRSRSRSKSGSRSGSHTPSAASRSRSHSKSQSRSRSGTPRQSVSRSGSASGSE